MNRFILAFSLIVLVSTGPLEAYDPRCRQAIERTAAGSIFRSATSRRKSPVEIGELKLTNLIPLFRKVEIPTDGLMELLLQLGNAQDRAIDEVLFEMPALTERLAYGVLETGATVGDGRQTFTGAYTEPNPRYLSRVEHSLFQSWACSLLPVRNIGSLDVPYLRFSVGVILLPTTRFQPPITPRERRAAQILFLGMTFHETRHALDFIRLRQWLRANLRLLKRGEKPDYLFENYVALVPENGKIKIYLDEAFSFLLLESASARVQGAVVSLLGEKSFGRNEAELNAAGIIPEAVQNRHFFSDTFLAQYTEKIPEAFIDSFRRLTGLSLEDPHTVRQVSEKLWETMDASVRRVGLSPFQMLLENLSRWDEFLED